MGKVKFGSLCPKLKKFIFLVLLCSLIPKCISFNPSSRSFYYLGQRSLIGNLSTFSKDFSTKNTGPISFKSHMHPPGKMGKQVYIFGSGHLTKVALKLGM